MKIRLKGAQKGHSLLKKKADALTLRFRQILAKIVEVCCWMVSVFASEVTTGLIISYLALNDTFHILE